MEFLRSKNARGRVPPVVSALAAGALTLVAVALQASAQTAIEPAIQTLTGIDTESDAHTSTITARLNKAGKPAKLELEDHGTFLQLVLRDTIIPEPGKFFDGNSPFVRKVAVFQTTSNDGALRLFTSKNAAKTRGAATVDTLADRIIVTIDHKKLNKILTEDPPTTVANRTEPPKTSVAPATEEQLTGLPKLDRLGTPDVNDVIARTEVREAGPPPAVRIATSPETTTPLAAVTTESPATETKTSEVAPPAVAAAEAASKTVAEPTTSVGEAPPVMAKAIDAAASTSSATGFKIGQNAPELTGKLQAMAVFSGVMLLLGFAVRWYRPRIARRLAGQKAPEPIISMRTLATMPLAAKQRLMLIQVGNDQVLLAISPDNVNYITTVSTAAATTTRVVQSDSTGRPLTNRLAAHMGAPAAAVQRSLASGFTGAIESPEEEETLDLRRAPSAASAAQESREAAKTGSAASPTRRSINLAVGDDGIKNVERPRGATKGSAQRVERKASAADRNSNTASPAGQENDSAGDASINDITRLIREKLRNLPAI